MFLRLREQKSTIAALSRREKDHLGNVVRTFGRKHLASKLRRQRRCSARPNVSVRISVDRVDVRRDMEVEESKYVSWSQLKKASRWVLYA